MSAAINLDNLQYMREVGIPDCDVTWYALFASSMSTRSQGEIQRARQIADQAFLGLCNTIVSRPARTAH